MKITVELGGKLIEHRNIAGFLASYLDQADGLAKISSVTAPDLGLMMVRCAMRGGFRSTAEPPSSARQGGCRFAIEPDADKKNESFDAGKIVSPQGVLLLDDEQPAPLLYVWDKDGAGFDWLMAVYLPKLEVRQGGRSVYEHVGRALNDHVMELQKAAAVAEAMAQGGGPHILRTDGKGRPG